MDKIVLDDAAVSYAPFITSCRGPVQFGIGRFSVLVCIEHCFCSFPDIIFLFHLYHGPGFSVISKERF